MTLQPDNLLPRLTEELERIQVHDHPCLLYETPAEQAGASAAFVQIGLARHERCIYLVAADGEEAVWQMLRDAGIAVEEAILSGALSICSVRDFYFEDEVFNPKKAVATFEHAAESAQASGYAAVRILCDMSWASETILDFHALISYEVRVNQILQERDLIIFCQYDRKRFPAETIQNIIFTHPWVMSHDALCRNYYYIPPEDFLHPGDANREVNRLLKNITDRQHAEEALKISEERFRKIWAEVPVGMASYDALGYLTEANRTFLDLFGIASVREVEGLSLFESSRLSPEHIQQLKSGKNVHEEILFDFWKARELKEYTTKKEGIAYLDVQITSVWLNGNVESYLVVVQDITELKNAEAERQITVQLLSQVNQMGSLREAVRTVTQTLQEWVGCEAIGIRLHSGEDYPYYETRGFPSTFVEGENSLCANDLTGQLARDAMGHPILECICGNVLKGRFDTSQPFFTDFGSFWTNSINDLAANVPMEMLGTHVRNRCGREGYESLALIPLKGPKTILGLLQLDDRRKNIFTPARIALLERLASGIALSLSHRWALEKLQESEQRYHVLFDTIPGGVFLRNTQGDIIHANEIARQMLHIGDRVLDEQHPWAGHWNMLDESGQLLRQEEQPSTLTLQTGEPVRNVVRGVYFDDPEAICYLLVNTEAVRDSVSGAIIGALVTFQDITELKRSEKALRDSEQRFSVAFHSSPTSISITRFRDNIMLDVNDTWTQVMGYSYEESVGHAASEFNLWVHPQERAQLVNLLHEQGRTRNFECQIRRKNGNLASLLIGAELLEMGGEPCMLMSAMDITERKVAEKKLAQINQCLLSLGTDHLKNINTLMDLCGDTLGAACTLYNRLEGGMLYPVGQCRVPIGFRNQDSALGRICLDLIQSGSDAALLLENLQASSYAQTDPNVQRDGLQTYLGHLVRNNGVPAGALCALFTDAKTISEDDKQIIGILAVALGVEETRYAAYLMLREKEEQFRMVTEQLPMAVVITNKEGKHIYANKGYTEIFGYTIADFPTAYDFFEKTLPDVSIREKIITSWERDLLETTREQRARDRVFELTCKNGTRKHVQFWPVAMSNGDLLTVCEDITVQKQMEQALEKRVSALTQPLGEQENVRFEDLFNLEDIQCLQDHFAEATGVASIISNVDGTPITRPSNFCRLCSKIRATEKGKANCYCSDAALGCFHPNGPIIQHCLSGGLWDAGASISVGGHHIANWLIGQVRDESQSVDKIRESAKQIGLDEEEAVTAFLEVPAMPLKRFENVSQTLFVMATQLSVIAYQNLQQARFITDQKLGAEALRASEAKFRRITTNIEDIVYSVDAKTWEYLYISPAFERILGYNWEDVQAAGGRRAFLPQIMPPELFEQQEQTFKQQTAAQNTTLPCQSEGWWYCKNGSKRYLEDRWILVYEADELVSCDGVLRDITERKMAEEQRNALQRQMEQTQRLESLGVLAGGIAHDFNNLLMGILGYADLAIEEISPMSPARESLGEIDKAARRAADLCRQMLAYSGKGKFVIELIHLRDLVAEMTHLLKTTISKKVELVLDLENSIPPMEGDSSQIRQVVMNLITNASEAIGDQAGTIRITTGIQACTTQDLANSYIDDNLSAGEYVYIEVADTGCGMARETLNHLFDPFFTTKFTGRGLGMAAVLGIVRGHKGAIKIQSEVGRGTTFQVFFPAHQPKKDDQKTTTESDEDQWKSSGTVLLVDDEETIRVLGERMLRRLGFRIIIASDGQEAVRIYGKQQAEIDYVVLDLTMPRMDGEETYQALCRINPKVRVIMSSGYTEQEISTRFAGKGLAGFLQKPYSLSALKRVFSPIK